MVLFNYATKEITAKIVYYGPGLCGKTTNLQFVYDSLPSNNKSKMLSLATKTDRTLFFDFLPLDLGKIRGMRTKLQLYTVPGQVYYNSTRQLVLKGADGIVFVADSQDFAVDANLESWQNLEDNLKRQGIRIREIPVVMQYNKRDLPNALSVAELETAVNKLKVPSFESVATTGIGVEQTIKGITQLVLAHLIRKYGLEGTEPLDREIQILNPNLPTEHASDESIWDDEDDNVLATEPPLGEAGFEVDDAADADDIPLVATELVGGTPAAAVAAPPLPARAPASPFDELTSYFDQPAPPAAADDEATEVPLTSVEIPLPQGILNSLPVLDQHFGTRAPAAAPAQTVERRATDGLVKEVTIPLNLTVEELRQHRKLRLKINIDINLLS
jgi:signal recognition particle receptor subunit beta